MPKEWVAGAEGRVAYGAVFLNRLKGISSGPRIPRGRPPGTLPKSSPLETV